MMDSPAVTPTPASKPAASARVVDFEKPHRDAFRDLNVEWITTHFALEDTDREVLDDPEHAILLRGGSILMAEDGGEIVGCCALIRIAPDAFELAKMAVAPAARGKGIGMLLGRAAVDRAQRMGARRVELLSNTALQPALHLYRKLGFIEVPLGPTEYRRANIRMELRLDSLLKCVLIVAEDLSLGPAANAAAILALTLGHRVPCLTGPDVVDAGGEVHAGLTWSTLPVLRAGRRQIGQIQSSARADETLTVVGLPEVAQRARSYDEYATQLAALAPADAAYLGVGLFGPRGPVTDLTRGLALLR
jgi:GNAT superfamily N-acetyltransferase